MQLQHDTAQDNMSSNMRQHDTTQVQHNTTWHNMSKTQDNTRQHKHNTIKHKYNTIQHKCKGNLGSKNMALLHIFFIEPYILKISFRNS